MKNYLKPAIAILMLFALIINFGMISFAENDEEGVYIPGVPAGETTTSAPPVTKSGFNKFIEDSGIGDTVNGVLNNINGNTLSGIGDTFANALSGISDTLSDTLSGYTDSLGGFFSSSSGETTTAASQTDNNSYSQFIVPTSPNNSAYIQTPDVVQQTETTTVPVQNTQETTTTQIQTVYPTSPQTQQPVSATVQSDNSGNIWIFVVAVAVVIFAILFVLILMTRRTQYNSRVYDRSTLKSVKRSRSGDDIIDDDGDPLDNIMPG